MSQMSPSDIAQIYRARSCSRQWTGFLQAMAAELSGELPENELALLMERIGRRFASEHALVTCAVLKDVETQTNRIWQSIDWGQCSMSERADHVEIMHAGAPLHVALTGADWSDGFLRGAYGQWFQQLGMLPGLTVHIGRAESQDLRRFVLSRAA